MRGGLKERYILSKTINLLARVHNTRVENLNILRCKNNKLLSICK